MNLGMRGLARQILPPTNLADLKIGASVAPNVPITLAAGNTYLPLDGGNATINYAEEVAAFSGDNTRFDVARSGRYLIVFSAFVHQHATDWITLGIFSDKNLGGGPTAAYPPAVLYDMGSDDISLSYCDFCELRGGIDRPAYIVYLAGPAVTLTYATCELQYLGPGVTV